jgi:hypothetical protein
MFRPITRPALAFPYSPSRDAFSTAAPGRRKMNAVRAIAVPCAALALLLAIPSGAAADTLRRHTQHRIELPGCPRPLTMSVPAEFTTASTQAEHELRKRTLDGWGLTTKNEDQWVEIFARDWASSDDVPVLAVVSLRSMLKGQGHYSFGFWKELKFKVRANAAHSGALSDSMNIRRQQRAPGSPRAIVHKTKVVDEDANSLTLVILGEERSDQASERLLIGSKLIYRDGCITFIILNHAPTADGLRRVADDLAGVMLW